MEKTIYDIMSSDPNRIDVFAQCCDDIINTQYILVDAKITAVLQSIATSKLLYSLFEVLTKGFDYKAVARACLVNNEAEFRTPQEPKKLAALVFCILLDMDKKNIEMHDFLHFFNRGGDINSAFELFLKEVILPFKSAVIYLFNKQLEEQKSPQAAQDNDNLDNGVESFERALGTFMARLDKDETLNEAIKSYLLDLLIELSTLLKQNDTLKAHNVHILLSKRLKTHKPALFKEFEKLNIFPPTTD